MAVLVTQAKAHMIAQSQVAKPTLEVGRYTTEVSKFILDLCKYQILTENQLAQLHRNHEDKFRDATTRERYAQVLVQLGAITSFQAARMISDQAKSLIMGNYYLVDRIAAGTVGVVFLARHRFLGRRVALKVITVDGSLPENVLARFDNEAKILEQIDHPNVVRILDAGSTLSESVENGTHYRYIACEFIDGIDVEDFLYQRNAPLELDETSKLIYQAAQGMKAFHQQGIIHRDIKPSNMLISEDWRLKIVDFGIAQDVKHRFPYNETLLGSLDFMPYEQCMDPEKACPGSDIYALGVSCFWLLTGHTPLPQARSIPEAQTIIREGSFRKISDYRKDIPIEVEGFVMRMLERDSRRRLSDAQDIVDFLKPYTRDKKIEEVTSAQPVNRDIPRVDTQAELAVYKSQARILEIKDGTGPQRQKRLTDVSALLVQSLKKRPVWDSILLPEAITALNLALPLLDIAMLVLPEKLTTSRSLLTREEVEILKQHPRMGVRLLEKMVQEVTEKPFYLSQVSEIIENHHEYQDGTGTPNGKKKEDIPPIAALAGLIDSYENLRRTRKKVPGLTHEQALAKILQEQADKYDPWTLVALREHQMPIASIYANYPDIS